MKNQIHLNTIYSGLLSMFVNFEMNPMETAAMTTIWKFDFSLSLNMKRFFQNFKMFQRLQFWVLWCHFGIVCYIFECLNVDLEMSRSCQILGQCQKICPKNIFSHYSESNPPTNFWFALKCRQYDCPSYIVGPIKRAYIFSSFFILFITLFQACISNSGESDQNCCHDSRLKIRSFRMS